MDFDGAAMIAGKKSGAQAKLKKNTTCYLHSLAIVQAANSTQGNQACLHYTHPFVEVLLSFPKEM